MPGEITISMDEYLIECSKKMYKALKEINEATNLKAQDVEFTKSKPMAEWICWAIDTAGNALESVEKNIQTED